MPDILKVNNVQAIRISGVLLRSVHKSHCIDCEGDTVWFPKDRVTIEPNGTILVQEWLYNDKVARGEL